jgi:hypothetical protein
MAMQLGGPPPAPGEHLYREIARAVAVLSFSDKMALFNCFQNAHAYAVVPPRFQAIFEKVATSVKAGT